MAVYTAYIGTGSVRGSQGIYTLRLDSHTGELSQIGITQARDSGYVALSPDGRTLYSVVECTTYHGKACAAVSAYHREADGTLTLLNTLPVDGQLAAHVSVDPKGNRVYVSAYLTGKLNVYSTRPDGGLDQCIHVIEDPNRDGLQAHIHCAIPTPDEAFLTVMEVGTDTVDLYDLHSGHYEKVSSLSFGGAHIRPRHVTYSADGRFAYVITEISNEIYVCSYHPEEREKLRIEQVVSTLPEGFQGMSFPAGIQISPNGKLLAATTRGPVPADAVALYTRDPDTGLLQPACFQQTTGESPRDFSFTPDGRLLLVGLQKSARMAVYRVDYDMPTLELLRDDFPLPASSCVIFAPDPEDLGG